jgi:hypothetical protein
MQHICQYCNIKCDNLGIHYGYPSCCVKYFIMYFYINCKTYDIFTEEEIKEAKIHARKKIALNGFRPCPECCKKIKKIEIAEFDKLITNRICTKPFSVKYKV